MTDGVPADPPKLLEVKTLKRRNFKKLALPSGLGSTGTASPNGLTNGSLTNGLTNGQHNGLGVDDYDLYKDTSYNNGKNGTNGTNTSHQDQNYNNSVKNPSDKPSTTIKSRHESRVSFDEKALSSNQLFLQQSRASNDTNGLTNQLASLELGVEFKLDLREEDVETLADLGSGNGGTVTKALHVPTKTIMAKKTIHIEKKPAVRKQIVRELHIMHDCDSPHIVGYYGAFASQSNVVMCMEYMDCGSLDRISKLHGPIAEDIIAKITQAIVEGLNYLYDEHRIIHRDVKPSNVLVNSKGQVKLADFGVSGELTNSIAETFVGTSTYMSPERIQGAAYSVKGDVWSLGLTVLQLAIGRFPFLSPSSNANSMNNHHVGILDLLQRIVNEEPPSLPDNGEFSPIFRRFVSKCLLKEEERPTPKQLLTSDAFYMAATQSTTSVQEWVQQFRISD